MKLVIDDDFLDRIVREDSDDPYEALGAEMRKLGPGDTVVWEELQRQHQHSHAEVKELCDTTMILALEQGYHVQIKHRRFIDRLPVVFGRDWEQIFQKYDDGYGKRG